MNGGGLTPENYSRGFLIDEQWMGGVAPVDQGFSAFVVEHETAETLFYKEFAALESALAALNAIPRDWKYEPVKECGGGSCGAGACGTSSCPGVCEKC